MANRNKQPNETPTVKKKQVKIVKNSSSGRYAIIVDGTQQLSRRSSEVHGFHSQRTAKVVAKNAAKSNSSVERQLQQEKLDTQAAIFATQRTREELKKKYKTLLKNKK